MKQLADIYGPKYTKENEESVKKSISSSARSFFGNYNAATDRKLFIAVMKLYGENIDPEWQAPEYVKLRKKCGGDFESIAGKLYSGSVFCDQVKFEKFLKDFRASSVKKLNKDPFYLLSLSASDFLTANVRPMLVEINGKLRDLNRRYMLAQMEFDTNRTFYPDANSTLRVAYGNVMGYESRDAVDFKCFTTLKGIMEKDNPSIYDYDVPEKLRQLYRSGDFGRYAQDDDVHVCFIANNHTTGGNSGSPVINADGQLIGINFDRAWEGVASDLAFNPAQSRNISLDIRYALFIIDKFAGAGYLLDEMTLVSK